MFIVFITVLMYAVNTRARARVRKLHDRFQESRLNNERPWDGDADGDVIIIMALRLHRSGQVG